jgi:alpha-N-arabinofuranosidase
VRTVFDSGDALAGSASIKGNTLTVSVTNAHARHSVEALIDFGGQHVKELSAATLTHDDIHAHNTFEAPAAVTPVTHASPDLEQARHTFPPASVTVLRFRI